MHPLIRFAAALFFLFLAALSVLGAPKSSPPVNTNLFHLIQINEMDNILPDSTTALILDKKSESVAEKSRVAGNRICSCQVLNLESSNYDHRYVVLLAEKTNDGSRTGFKAARNRILKEKKQLKKLFYDRVKLVAELQGNGSCKSMYFQLRSVDNQLQFYEILNAD